MSAEILDFWAADLTGQLVEEIPSESVSAIASNAAPARSAAPINAAATVPKVRSERFIHRTLRRWR